MAVIARTGFFVLCSVFKEHVRSARPEGEPPAGAGGQNSVPTRRPVLVLTGSTWSGVVPRNFSHPEPASRGCGDFELP